MIRVVWLLAGVAGLGALTWGCDDEDDAAKQKSEAAKESAQQGPWDDDPTAIPSDQPGASKAHRAHLNLLNLTHLADVHHHGLFVDFGTPARAKYTVGGWRTGWGEDGGEGDDRFTYLASTTGRVYLPIDEKGPVTLRFRLKPVGTDGMMLFLNNHQLPSVEFDKGKKLATYDVEVPAEHVVEGENYLLLRPGSTKKVAGEAVSLAVESLRVIPGHDVEDPAGVQLPRAGSLVADHEVAGQKQRSLSVRAPTRLSWHVQVPRDAKLSFRAAAPEPKGGKVRGKVRIVAPGGKAREVFSAKLGSAWLQKVVSLQPWAGRVVRVDLVTEGDPDALAAWSSPAILVPETELEGKDAEARNVIVLMVDTLRADKLKVYDPDTRVDTPAFSRFAEEGVVFEAAQSPENWTKPAVASVLTGLFPMTHGTKESEAKLPSQALMVSEVFKKKGFATGSFIANGYVSDKFGFDQGWDYYTNYIREGKSTVAENVFREAGDWIEKQKDERFFAYVQTIDPHVPYDPPDSFLKKYDARPYSGQVKPRMTANLLEKAKRNPPKVTFDRRDRQRLEALHDGEISYHDKHLAAFIERLKKLGVYENSIFVVTSDHGEEFYDHESYGHGHSVYQELLHVPFMVRWPGTVPAGKRISETVSTLDIAPTILAAAGVAVPEVMEGIDRGPHMRGRVPAGPAVAFSDFLDDRRVIRAGRWKLILRGTNATLFDLERDPAEQHELDPLQHPLAMRYCRVMLGQLMGAEDRRRWYHGQGAAASSQGLRGEDAEIDPELREQLRGLGYAH